MKGMKKMIDLLDEISRIGIVPVVVLNDAQKAVPVANALRNGGINCAEVTFRTAAAKESIKLMAEAFPDMLVGAGTVLSERQVDEAVLAGAKFIVTPGYNPTVVDYCIAEGIPIIPGCMDTNAIEMALEAGLDTIKFFPAEAAGGLKMLKALAGPYVNLKFMPTGGINEKNIAAYLAFKKVVACGGSWMITPDLIDAEKYDEITAMTKSAVAAVLGFELQQVIIGQSDGDGGSFETHKFGAIFGKANETAEGITFENLPVASAKDGLNMLVTGCNDISRSVYHLEKRGFHMDMDSAVYSDGRIMEICLEEKFGGFLIKLVNKS